jgi:hypothetical protein
MATRIQLRRGNANSWLSSNPILSSGEIGIETDTNLIKIGDSSNTWANLAYFSPSIGSTSNLAEGANLYFTNTRARAAFTQGTGIVIAANGLISSTALGGVTSVNGANGNVQLFYSSNTEPVTNTTGTFWYKPDEGNIFIKVNDGVANIWLEIDTPFFSTTSNTTDIAEGANLYFTNSRSVAALTSGYGINIDANGLITSLGLGGGGTGNITAVAGVTSGAVSNVQLANAISSTGLLTTANVIESGNLYFTNTRSVSALSAGYGIEVAANGRLTATIASAAIGNVTGVAGVNTGNVSNAQISSALALQNVTVNNLTVTQSVVGSLSLTGSLTTAANLSVAGNATITGNLSTNNFTTNSLSVGNITVTGNIVPTVNEAFSLGTPSFKFKDLFLSGSTIVLGETKLQSDPAGGFSISSLNVEQTGSITFSTAANAALVTEVITSNVLTVDSITSNTWGSLYTANVVETSDNLYFTNTRAISALTAGRGIEVEANGLITSLYNIESIAGVANGVVSNIQIAFAIQDTALLNTANIIEGGNLYYTNARVAANVATLGYAPNAYVNTRLLTKANVSDLTPLATNSHVTAVVNLLQTTKANNEDVTNLTTGNIPENETNLYFTNTRVVYALYTDDSLILDANGRLIANVAAVGGGTITSVAGVNFGGVSNVQLASALTDRTVSLANLTVTETATINSLRVTGDMSVTGTTTFINTTEVAINDKNLVLANGAASSGVANGAGISISGAYANLTYYSGPDRFNFNRYVDVQGNTILTNANTTTHISEGTNLYFTNTRAVYALTSGNGIDLNSNGLIQVRTANIGAIASACTTPATASLSTTVVANAFSIGSYVGGNPNIFVFAGQTLAFNLVGMTSHPFSIQNTTGSNLLSGLTHVSTNGVIDSTANVQGQTSGRLFFTPSFADVGNVYSYRSLTNANVRGNIIIVHPKLTAGTGINIAANGLITSTALGGVTGDVVSVNGSNGIIELYYTSNTAPNANTLGTLWYKPDQGNIYFYVNDGSSNVWLEIDQGGGAGGAVDSVNGETGAVVLTTANIAESGNLYFTNTRAISSLTSGSGISIAANGLITSTGVSGVSSVNAKTGTVNLITDDIPEGSNVYYSNARVQSYLGNISGNLVPSVDEVYSLGSANLKWLNLFLSGNTIILGNTKIESSGDGSLSIKSTDPNVTTYVTFSSNGYVSTSTGSFGSTASTFPSGDLGELGLALEFDAFGTLLTDINIFDCMNPPRITNLEDLGEL